MEISFERATEADAESLVTAQIAAFHYDSVLYPHVELGGPPGYDSVAHMRQAIHEDESYKILDGETIIGGIVVFDRGEGNYHLDVIFIDPTYQSRGVGTQAIHFLERTYPARLWTLDTPKYAIRNQHFYEKMGYVRVREFDQDGFELYAYEKHIPDHP